MATVNIVDVSKRYGQQLILDRVNLSIEKGEFVAVVGPSGCGKSTLLRLVAGLDEMSSGQILINGKCVNEIHPSRRDMAMVFQSYALYPHMSVYDNMAYGLKMRGMKSHDIKMRVDEVASMLKLADYLQRKPQELSGGQRQRVAMGRAIVRSPAVFLFDEPLSNLDANLRAEMRHEIKKLHQQLNTTCLYVTHDQVEAMTMASRVVVLNHGQIEQIGSPQTLYQKPASMFVAEFIGQYPINFIPAKIDTAQGTVVTETGIEFPLPPTNAPVTDHDEVVLGVRPEHLVLTPRGKPGSIPVNIEFIDDMGADKLVQMRSVCETHRFSIRTSADIQVNDSEAGMELIFNKINLFHKKTGLRLGGWHGETSR